MMTLLITFAIMAALWAFWMGLCDP